MESVQPRIKLLLAGAKLLQPMGRRQDLCGCAEGTEWDSEQLSAHGPSVLSQLGPCLTNPC